MWWSLFSKPATESKKGGYLEMALESKVYRALEDIVGVENISQEPAILDTYAFQMGTKAVPIRIWMTRPEAVVLPGSVEEVQAIVKACNRYGIRFKAISTGFATAANIARPGTIHIDPRRMNRILELNERDMYAVVEPYVTWVQLQAEAMKKGLNCNTAECGGQASVLANCTSGWGMGGKSVAMGHNERNVLGVEWVLPTGNILRLGSVGSGDGWFCGDGPGPSLRGIMRGFLGAWGGLGVFTKVAVKLYHWPGPPDFFPLKGLSPVYEAELPKTVRTYYCFFDNWEDFADAGLKVGETEIAAEFEKVSPAAVAIMTSKSNQEFAQIYHMIRTLVKGPGFQVLIMADSQQEFDYKEKVLMQILAEKRGKNLPLVTHERMQGRVIPQLVKVSSIARVCFRPTGAYSSTMGSMDTWDLGITQAKIGAELKQKYVDMGVLFDDGVENGWGLLYEDGHFGHLEMLNNYDPADPESCRMFQESLSEATDKMITGCLGVPFGGGGDRMADILGPHIMNYPHWLRKIKKAFDPNVASDPSSYVRLKE